jgi:hypothetical protein
MKKYLKRLKEMQDEFGDEYNPKQRVNNWFTIGDLINEIEALTLTDVSESCKINGKGLCGYSDKLGLCPRCDTDAYSR